MRIAFDARAWERPPHSFSRVLRLLVLSARKMGWEFELWTEGELQPGFRPFQPQVLRVTEAREKTRADLLWAPHPEFLASQLVNPQRFKVISASVNKTDENDARCLARFLEKDLLPEVRMKDKAHAQMASLAQARDKLVNLRTALKNKINDILSAHGINLKKESLSSDKGLEDVLGMMFGDVVDVELRVLVEQIRSLNKSIGELDRTIKEQGPKLPGHQNIKSIKGIGDVGSGVLLSVIGDVHNLSSPGKLAAYFGIVPRVSNSNETQRSGRITKRGSKLGRTTLVQCWLVAMRYSSYLLKWSRQVIIGE